MTNLDGGNHTIMLPQYVVTDLKAPCWGANRRTPEATKDFSYISFSSRRLIAVIFSFSFFLLKR
jgi:hypothetical protein